MIKTDNTKVNLNLLKEVEKVKQRFKTGVKIHKTEMNNNNLSTVEKNRASYLHFQCSSFVDALEKITTK